MEMSTSPCCQPYNVAQTGSKEYMIAAWVGLRYFWNAFSIRIQASEPNSPKHNSGTITPSCQADSNTITSLDETSAMMPAPITKTKNEVDVTAIGLSCLVIRSV